MPMSLAVVVPHHSNVGRLRACLDSLLETTSPSVPIIVVANNQEPNALVAARDVAAQGRVSVLAIQENMGYARAVNAGVAATDSALVAVCDDDARCMPGWLESHLKTHEIVPNVAVTGSMLLDPASGRIWSVGIGVAGYTLNHPFRGRPPDVPLLSPPRKVQMLCSAVMVVNKAVWQSLGGLDENLPFFFSDPDYCIRATTSGYCSIVLPDSRAFHGGNGSAWSRAGKREDQKSYFFAKNRGAFEDDLDAHLDEQMAFFLKDHILAAEYVVVNISTCVDWERHIAPLAKRTSIVNRYTFQAPVRDADRLPLLDLVGYPVACFRTPIIYLVDVYYGLRNNVMWQRLRHGKGDIVVDRHANVIAFDAVSPCGA